MGVKYWPPFVTKVVRHAVVVVSLMERRKEVRSTLVVAN
jgi:hypothetical protein